MKIYIWGTGSGSKELADNGITEQAEGFIVEKKTTEACMGLPVYDISSIPAEYDYIIVASEYVDRAYRICTENRIDMKKIIFLSPVRKSEGMTDLNIIYKILDEKNYTGYCAKAGVQNNTFFERDLKRYGELNRRETFKAKKEQFWPIIGDKFAKAGAISNYFWQDLWAARLILESGVKKHFDIGSRLDGFIAHLLSANIDVTMIDVREFPGKVEHLYTIVDDATYLRQIPDESIESMSALCSLEHFGLGRYGDPVDPEACFTCFKNIQKKLCKGGKLYISVPVGQERVEFNAHRVFYARTIRQCFAELHLEDFSCAVQGEIEYNVELNKYDDDRHCGGHIYGLFYFIKK